MNKIIEKSNIKDMIYEIRGVQVMLDSDLAKIYHVETKRINEAVRRNKQKFPQEFSWQLTDEESDFLVAICDQKKETRGGKYKNPRVFTEQGVYMLATILKSKAAIETTISIIESFVTIRNYFRNFVDTNEVLINHENRLFKLENAFDEFINGAKTNRIIFKGETYDAYSILMDILSKSSEEIIIIDNYAGKELLDILKGINKRIIMVSKNTDDILKKKYESQYNNITFLNNNTFHDRFIIIDRKILYVCGSSFKDLGKKCFYIGEINNKYIEMIINNLTIDN